MPARVPRGVEPLARSALRRAGHAPRRARHRRGPRAGTDASSYYELEAKPGTRFTHRHGAELARQADSWRITEPRRGGLPLVRDRELLPRQPARAAQPGLLDGTRLLGIGISASPRSGWSRAPTNQLAGGLHPTRSRQHSATALARAPHRRGRWARASACCSSSLRRAAARVSGLRACDQPGIDLTRVHQEQLRRPSDNMGPANVIRVSPDRNPSPRARSPACRRGLHRGRRPIGSRTPCRAGRDRGLAVDRAPRALRAQGAGRARPCHAPSCRRPRVSLHGARAPGIEPSPLAPVPSLRAAASSIPPSPAKRATDLGSSLRSLARHHGGAPRRARAAAAAARDGRRDHGLGRRRDTRAGRRHQPAAWARDYINEIGSAGLRLGARTLRARLSDSSLRQAASAGSCSGLEPVFTAARRGVPRLLGGTAACSPISAPGARALRRGRHTIEGTAAAPGGAARRARHRSPLTSARHALAASPWWRRTTVASNLGTVRPVDRPPRRTKLRWCETVRRQRSPSRGSVEEIYDA